MKNIELYYNDLKCRAEELYNQFSELSEIFNKQKYQREFDFLIEENNDVNGCAYVESNRDIIRINKGLIDKFFGYFSDYTDCLIKKTIGRNESLDLRSIEVIGINISDKETIDLYEYFNNLKSLLLTLLSRFVLLHELGHIFNGHCDYIKSNCGMNQIDMFPKLDNFSVDNKDKLTIRTIEMDADAFAATQSMYHLLFIYEDKVYNEIDFVDKLDIFYWWAFAIYSHFIYFEDLLYLNGKCGAEKYSTSLKHLPPNARWILIYACCESFLEKNDKIRQEEKKERIKEKILKKLVDGMVEAEKVWNELKAIDYDKKFSIKDEQKDIFQIYVNEVMNHWDKIRNDLDKFARLNLYKKE